MRRLATLGFVIAAAAVTAAGQFTITTASVPTANVGLPYPNVSLQATGATGPFEWSFVEGGPPNFTVDQAPAVTGTFCYRSCGGFAVQETPGQYSFTIQAYSPTTGVYAYKDFTLVVERPLQIVTTSLPNANANQTYQTQMQGSGGTGNFTWSIFSGTLPPGITLTDPVKGILAGTAPGVNGTYPFTVRLLDQATLESVTRALSITIVNGIAILTTSLPDAIVNQAYSYQLQGTGQNLVWTPAPGTVFPPNLTLTSDGILSGPVIATGSFSIAVQLVNSQVPSAPATRNFTLLVTLGPLGINERTLPGATRNVPYSTTLTATGGIPPYTWGLDVSAPKGLSIDSSNGILSGTLTTAGSFPVPVTLRDSTGATVSVTYTLAVGNAVSITTTSLPNGAPNAPYSATLTAVGGSIPYHWDVIAGSLPPGLAINTLFNSMGQISGTPTAQGSFPFTVKVTDFNGGTDTKALTIVTGQFLVITTASLPGAARNQPYPQTTLTAVNGTPPYTWSIASGTLPAGLQLNGSTGVVSGTPTVVGDSSFDVLVTDATSTTGRKSFTINVANNPVVITNSSFSGDVLVAFSQTLAATGGTPPYTWSISSGTLPGGLQLNSTTGVISGTPSPQGISPVLFTATDSTA